MVSLRAVCRDFRIAFDACVRQLALTAPFPAVPSGQMPCYNRLQLLFPRLVKVYVAAATGHALRLVLSDLASCSEGYLTEVSIYQSDATWLPEEVTLLGRGLTTLRVNYTALAALPVTGLERLARLRVRTLAGGGTSCSTASAVFAPNEPHP
jgi:hypothetical protein